MSNRFNVITWNSNGESQAKADCLKAVFDDLLWRGWTPEIVFIQEANATADGPINEYLNTSGLFQTPVAVAPEGGNQGRAYLMAIAPGISVTKSFSAYPLIDDPAVDEWIDETFSSSMKESVIQEVTDFRNLGVAEIERDGATVRLATWHAPRGNSVMGTVPASLPGGGNPDAFVTLEVSELYEWLQDVDTDRAASIDGDLNITQSAIGEPIYLPPEGDPYEVLEGWVGYGRNLDLVTGYFDGGQGYVENGFDYSLCTDVANGLSDHFIVGGTLVWPLAGDGAPDR